MCFGTESSKSGSASISTYRYARNNNDVQEADDEHFYGNVEVNFREYFCFWLSMKSCLMYSMPLPVASCRVYRMTAEFN